MQYRSGGSAAAGRDASLQKTQRGAKNDVSASFRDRSRSSRAGAGRVDSRKAFRCARCGRPPQEPASLRVLGGVEFLLQEK
ncbi:hypothetical protein EVAR_18800_1 [Eumeta japonica]|uniref:Uncharacterized protein n=1 Tax=Eumeta variegata TaxID=151549 RepID=A0A4C1UMK4_EUMVA|nr:hypothetical protein EVAR_18800_1 [Eumeta japonica]